MTSQKIVGEIAHYFGRVKVAVIKLKNNLKVGDVVRIVGGENTDFEQKIASIEVDHEKIKEAKKGKSVGIKVKKPVREGYKVYKS